MSSYVHVHVQAYNPRTSPSGVPTYLSVEPSILEIGIPASSTVVSVLGEVRRKMWEMKYIIKCGRNKLGSSHSPSLPCFIKNGRRNWGGNWKKIIEQSHANASHARLQPAISGWDTRTCSIMYTIHPCRVARPQICTPPSTFLLPTPVECAMGGARLPRNLQDMLCKLVPRARMQTTDPNYSNCQHDPTSSRPTLSVHIRYELSLFGDWCVIRATLGRKHRPIVFSTKLVMTSLKGPGRGLDAVVRTSRELPRAMATPRRRIWTPSWLLLPQCCREEGAFPMHYFIHFFTQVQASLPSQK